MIPLLAPKALSEFTPEEFHDYVRSLYIEPERPAPLAEYSATLNKKGTLTVRIRRKPKYLTASEVTALAAEIGWTLQTLWVTLLKRKIEIRRG